MKNKIQTISQFGGAAFAGAVLLLAASAPAQNLFVANGTFNDIIEITPDGTQSTFASGFVNPYGLAFNSVGDLFVANYGDNDIIEITPGGDVTFASGLDPIGLVFQGETLPVPEPSILALCIFGAGIMTFLYGRTVPSLRRKN